MERGGEGGDGSYNNNTSIKKAIIIRRLVLKK
jgi:hypothetical protein